MKEIIIDSEFIKLDQFLKLSEIASSGGEAKVMIMSEEIFVNGEIETRRGRKIRSGDTVGYKDRLIKVK